MNKFVPTLFHLLEGHLLRSGAYVCKRGERWERYHCISLRLPPPPIAERRPRCKSANLNERLCTNPFFLPGVDHVRKGFGTCPCIPPITPDHFHIAWDICLQKDDVNILLAKNFPKFDISSWFEAMGGRVLRTIYWKFVNFVFPMCEEIDGLCEPAIGFQKALGEFPSAYR